MKDERSFMRLPWTVEMSHDRQEGNDQRPMPYIQDRRGGRIARMWVRETSHEQKAEFLLRAVNNYHDLLAACKAVVRSENIAAGEPGHIDLADAWEMCRTAIAKATA